MGMAAVPRACRDDPHGDGKRTVMPEHFQRRGPNERSAAYTPLPGGFLERNPHLIDNYLAACADLGEKPGDVPEEVGAVGRERPPEHVFEAFRRLHGIK